MWQQRQTHRHVCFNRQTQACAAVVVDDAPCSRLLSPVLRFVLKVNGKMRGTVELPPAAAQDAALEAAQGLAAVQRQLEGREIKKVIYVPGKILNLIIPGGK